MNTRRCVLSVLCRDVLLPGNSVGSRSCERQPSHRLSDRKEKNKTSSSVLAVFQASTDSKSLLFRPHLERVFGNAAAFTQALHHGFVPQDVLLAQVLSPLARLQHQAVHRVEVGQEVSHPLLCDKQADKLTRKVTFNSHYSKWIIL